MKVAIYGIEFQHTVMPYVEQLFRLLRKWDVEIWIYKDFEQFLSTFMEVGSLERFENRMDLPPDIEFMLSLGGDGTMLSAVSLLHDSEIPVTGINLGRLGFLASINKDNIEPAIVSLLKKEY